MSVEAVARRYAKALFEIGREKGQLEATTRQLADFAEIYETNSEFRTVASLPMVRDEDRAAIIGEIGQRLGVSSEITRAVTLLAERQRLAALPAVAEELAVLTDEHLGIVRADVRAAAELPKSYLDQLQKRIAEETGKRVVITFERDPALIAGVVTQIGDRVIDGSVRGKLHELADSLRHS